MKRVLIIAVPCLAALLLSTSFASGQSSIQKTVASAVTAKASPKKDLTGARVFRIKGTALPTAKPYKCAAGVTNPVYCSPAKLVDVCIGNVRLTIKRGLITVARKTLKLKIDCTYSAKISLKKKTKHGKLTMRTRFLGNAVVAPSNSKKVTIKV